MLIGLSMAAERESHACVSQPHSAERPNHANLLQAQGQSGKRMAVGQLISLPIKMSPATQVR